MTIRSPPVSHHTSVVGEIVTHPEPAETDETAPPPPPLVEALVDDVEGQAPRAIRVSNFVLPTWFVLGSAGPWDYMGVLDGPQKLTPGGYVIQDDNGNVTNVFGSERARSNLDAKKATPFSRAARRTSKLEAAKLGVDWVDHHRSKYSGAAA